MTKVIYKDGHYEVYKNGFFSVLPTQDTKQSKTGKKQKQKKRMGSKIPIL